jgi:hypothetical protein
LLLEFYCLDCSRKSINEHPGCLGFAEIGIALMVGKKGWSGRENGTLLQEEGLTLALNLL